MSKKASAVFVSLLLACIGFGVSGQEKKIKTGLTKEDWAYKLAEGVWSREAAQARPIADNHHEAFFDVRNFKVP